jgi:UDP-glucuronate 4-epimerase
LKEHVLVTGCAGFIGFHLCRRLCKEGFSVTGIDNINDYYDPSLKHARLDILQGHSEFTFQKLDLTEKSSIDSLSSAKGFAYVINLAAQAGVRHSITHPYAYLESNIHGFLNILEACRNYRPRHLIYASSSSVYGSNKSIPFSVHDNVDHPLALYAASKKSNELMAHAYSNLYQLPTTGLRFFTAYGPYGRPDMALFIFTKAILAGQPIDVYNFGKMRRDFTYVDDIVEGIVRLIPKVPQPDKSWDAKKADPATSFAPYRIYNIGNDQPVELLHYIEVLEEKLGKKAIRNYLPLQEGDISEAHADITALQKEIGFRPATSVEEGIGKFVDWYKEYYKVK